jgi:hypothetical protein
MQRFLIALAAVAVISLAGAATGHAGGSYQTRTCGLTGRIDGVRYDVRETRGAVACTTVKRVVTKFLRDDTVTAHWACFRGHGSSPYAASCARGHKVVVRVYAPT